MDLKNNVVLAVIARSGYITKGVVYFFIGVLAMRVTWGLGGELANSKQVLRMFYDQPLGYLLLIICTAGLLAHGVWRITQGLLDPEERDGGFSQAFFRTVDFITGLLYFSLAYAGFQILTGKGTESSENSIETWISDILELPFGSWMVVGIAAVCLFGGLYQFYAAYTASFDYSFDTEEMSDGQKTFLRILGRIGLAAWGIVYLMIAVLVYNAAVHYDPSQAAGLEGALVTLSEQPYGLWIMSATSTGLLAYGVYLLVLARFHKIYGS